LISKVTILNAISDRTASDIFRCVASTHPNSELLKTHLKLTRKQYYARMSLLIKAGLVKKEKGRYLLTTLGKVISAAQLNLEEKFESAIDNYWKLKAVDSLERFDERNKIISVLIDNEEIKNVLLNEGPNKATEAVKVVGGVPAHRDKPLTFNV
jgi:predicted transcriptional regulator